MNKNRRTFITVSLGIILVPIVLFLTAGVVCSTFRPHCVDRSSYTRVGGKFGQALLYNDLKSAKGLSHPDLWQEIEPWMVQHKPLPYSLWECGDWDAPIGGGVGGTKGSDADHATFGGYYQCPTHCCYFFSYDLELEKSNDRWQVMKWQVGETE